MKPALMEQLLRSYLSHRFPPEHSSETQEKSSATSFQQQSKAFDEVDSPLQRGIPFEYESYEQINSIAARLVKMADDFQKSLEMQRDRRKGSLTEESDEFNNPSLSVPSIAHNLSTSLNPETFRKALHSVCQQATSLSLEAALALEFTAHVYQIIGFKNGDFIPNAVAQYFGSRISMEDLQKISPHEDPVVEKRNQE